MRTARGIKQGMAAILCAALTVCFLGTGLPQPVRADTETPVNSELTRQLLVQTEDPSIFEGDGTVLPVSADVYLLTFDSGGETEEAYDYYLTHADCVEYDSEVVLIAEEADYENMSESETEGKTESEPEIAAEDETIPEAAPEDNEKDPPVTGNSESETVPEENTDLESEIPPETVTDADPETASEPAEETKPVGDSENVSAEDSDNVPVEDPEHAPAEEPTAPLIALIDTGAEPSENVVERISFIGEDPGDDNGHGTRMLEAMKEIDPDVRVLSIKALDGNGKGSKSALYAAIRYAIDRKADIISLSVSSKKGENDTLIPDLIKEACAQGILVVGAAGNRNEDASDSVPGGINEALIAGAAGEDGNKTESSNFGPTVDLNVLAQSTSYAAAKLSAYAALKIKEEGAFLPGPVPGFLFLPSMPGQGEESGGGGEAEPDPEEIPEGRTPDLTIRLILTFHEPGTDIYEDTIAIAGNDEMPAYVEDGRIRCRINRDPEIMDFAMYDGFPWVFIDYMSPVSEKIITEECTYDRETGWIEIPAAYRDDYITVQATLPTDSAAYYYLIPEDYKTVPAGWDFIGADWKENPRTYSNSLVYHSAGSNVVTTDAVLGQYKVGDQFNNVEAWVGHVQSNYSALNFTKVLPKMDKAYGNYGIVSGNKFYFMVSFTKVPGAPEFENIGETPSGSKNGTFRDKNNKKYTFDVKTRNWLYGTCLGDGISGDTPHAVNGKIRIVKKTVNGDKVTLRCWYGLHVLGSQDVGMYFDITGKAEEEEVIPEEDFAPITLQAGGDGGAAFMRGGVGMLMLSAAVCGKDAFRIRRRKTEKSTTKQRKAKKIRKN